MLISKDYIVLLRVDTSRSLPLIYTYKFSMTFFNFSIYYSYAFISPLIFSFYFSLYYNSDFKRDSLLFRWMISAKSQFIFSKCCCFNIRRATFYYEIRLYYYNCEFAEDLRMSITRLQLFNYWVSWLTLLYFSFKSYTSSLLTSEMVLILSSNCFSFILNPSIMD